jgi:addiction module RelE/StbE family toxin
MMHVYFHKHFDKMFEKCSPAVKKKFRERIILFLKNPFAEELGNHALHGEYDGLRSINITGDIRAVYDPVDNPHVRFLSIGSHAQLHG